MRLACDFVPSFTPKKKTPGFDFSLLLENLIPEGHYNLTTTN